MSTFGGIRVRIASPPDREQLVAELLIAQGQLAAFGMRMRNSWSISILKSVEGRGSCEQRIFGMLWPRAWRCFGVATIAEAMSSDVS
jgi:hypothetical protein